jgi:hypothetical protein
MARRGLVAKGSRSEGCRGAEHGQTCNNKDRNGAVAVRAALESTVLVGRGHEVFRQAEMANLTKLREVQGFATGVACAQLCLGRCITRSGDTSPQEFVGQACASNWTVSADASRRRHYRHSHVTSILPP